VLHCTVPGAALSRTLLGRPALSCTTPCAVMLHCIARPVWTALLCIVHAVLGFLHCVELWSSVDVYCTATHFRRLYYTAAALDCTFCTWSPVCLCTVLHCRLFCLLCLLRTLPCCSACLECTICLWTHQHLWSHFFDPYFFLPARM
jgi:hypothetical protein